MKIVMIEDHQVVAEGISSMLNEVAYVENVVQMPNGMSAMEYLNKHADVDIILLDINLPDCNRI